MSDAILKAIPTIQAAALASYMAKKARKKKKSLIGLAAAGIVGTALIQAESKLI